MGSYAFLSTATECFPVATQEEYKRCVQVVRANTAREFRRHSDFEHAASRVIERAGRTWRPSEGVSFEGYLAVSAKRSMSKEIRREIGRLAEVSSPPDDQVVCPKSSLLFEETESRLALSAILGNLPRAEREVAAGLALGLSTSEIAELRGVRRREVNRAIARLRPRAAAAFALSD